RNALNPVITMTTLQLGTLFGGSVVTETVFAWPGLGRTGQRHRHRRHLRRAEPGHRRDLRRHQPGGALPPFSPGHVLGTDALGRDLLTRIIYGSRVSLLVGAASVLLAGTIGTVIGLLSGYLGGRFDRMVIRIIAAQLSFPFMILALTLAALLGPSLRNVIITLVVSSWVIYARLVRGQVLEEREREYVQAARALGAS